MRSLGGAQGKVAPASPQHSQPRESQAPVHPMGCAGEPRLGPNLCRAEGGIAPIRHSARAERVHAPWGLGASRISLSWRGDREAANFLAGARTRRAELELPITPP